MKIKKFEDLEIWKSSMDFTKEIYALSAKGDFAKDFGLRDQVRRAIVSVSSNIVEGFEKNNNNEFIRFLKIAKGSAGEVRNHLYIALAVGHISSEEFSKLDNKLQKLGMQIGNFISYLTQKRRAREFIQ